MFKHRTKKAALNEERYLQYGSKKRDGASWSENTLTHLKNGDYSESDYHWYVSNKSRLRRMPKSDAVRIMKDRLPYPDRKNVKDRYVRKSYIFDDD